MPLGAGKPLLPRAMTSPPLRLLSGRAVGEGFAELHYAVPRPDGVRSLADGELVEFERRASPVGFEARHVVKLPE